MTDDIQVKSYQLTCVSLSDCQSVSLSAYQPVSLSACQGQVTDDMWVLSLVLVLMVVPLKFFRVCFFFTKVRMKEGDNAFLMALLYYTRCFEVFS